MEIRTTYSFEITLDIVGQFVAGYPETGPTYSCGGEPGEPDGVEDLDIEGMQFERVERRFVPDHVSVQPVEQMTAEEKAARVSPRLTLGGKFENRIVAHDLFAGVDKTNPEVLKLIANMVDAIRHDAESDLLETYKGGLA